MLHFGLSFLEFKRVCILHRYLTIRNVLSMVPPIYKKLQQEFEGVFV